MIAAPALALCLILSACGGRPPPGILTPVAQTDPQAKQVDVIVATTREFDPATDAFSTKRGDGLLFQKVDVSIPPNHKDGALEAPEELPGDPSRNFVTTQNRDLSEAEFRAEVTKHLGKSGEVLVFIHGYNTTHQEAVFRMAQITNDSGYRGASVLFSWPSQGELSGYLYDRESSTYSRDQLEHTIHVLAATPGVKKINLLAHSMGNWLTVEMLRQARIRGDVEFGGKLGQVILASPDVDLDVFRKDIFLIGPRKPPIVMLVSRNDYALQVSERLAGRVRAGAAVIDNPQAQKAIQQAGMIVIDMTKVDSNDALNHSKFAESPAIIQNIGRQLNGVQEKSNAPTSVGGFVLDAAGQVLGAPKTIFDTVTLRNGGGGM
ncbi:alpha/beta hydrolase [Methylovirgula sp. 4M-Z18]|uniref:alpha/beta hydrolase n=1 Tax=Methylovirgula sp. 4M-Z18 TaxID=2293567 RepID=UPI0013147A0F|nr:alpha/beta hydrolase [Methylovirgula sp. 4M-Z18]